MLQCHFARPGFVNAPAKGALTGCMQADARTGSPPKQSERYRLVSLGPTGDAPPWVKLRSRSEWEEGTTSRNLMFLQMGCDQNTEMEVLCRTPGVPDAELVSLF